MILRFFSLKTQLHTHKKRFIIDVIIPNHKGALKNVLQKCCLRVVFSCIFLPERGRGGKLKKLFFKTEIPK